MPFDRFNAVHQYPHDESSSNLLDDVDFAPHEVFENGRTEFEAKVQESSVSEFVE